MTRWPTCGNTDVPLDYSGGISQDCQRGTYLSSAQVVSPIIASLLLRLPRNWLGCAWLAKVYRSIGETLGLTRASCVILPQLGTMPHLWTITSLSRPLTKQKRPTISRERFFRAAKSFSGPIIAIASNLPNAHFHKQTRSSDLFGKSEISLQVLNTSYITSEIVPVRIFANLSHGSNLGLLMPYFWIWESALPFVAEQGN